MSNNNINSNAFRALHKFSLNSHLAATPDQPQTSQATPESRPVKHFLTHQPITTGNPDSVSTNSANSNGNSSVMSPFGGWQSDRIELKREPDSVAKQAEKRVSNLLSSWHAENPDASGEDLKALLSKRLGAKFIT